MSFTNDKFYYDKDLNKAICPAGKQLYTAGTVISKIGLETHRFKGAVRDCAPCAHRKQCLQNPEKSKIRQLSLYKSTVDTVERRQIDRMQEKIDTEQGRHEYSRRMGIVEPVFGNITSTLGLDRFTLRDSKKVNIQWKLYTMVHNLLKVHRYGQWSEVTE